MLKRSIAQTTIVFLLLSSMMGCAFKGKRTLFEREGDILVPSPCEQCSGKPFYVHGHWVSDV